MVQDAQKTGVQISPRFLPANFYTPIEILILVL